MVLNPLELSFERNLEQFGDVGFGISTSMYSSMFSGQFCLELRGPNAKRNMDSKDRLRKFMIQLRTLPGVALEAMHAK